MNHINESKGDGFLEISLARPEKKNALTSAMYTKLANVISSAENDHSIRAILLRAEGDMFTAGNDIEDFVAMSKDCVSVERPVINFLEALANCTKPLVAAVQGRAVGIGTTMLLHFDVVVLDDNAILSTPFVNLALVPEAASSLLLPLRIGYLRAFGMVALGNVMGAGEAQTLGMATKTVPSKDLYPEALRYVKMLVKQPPVALATTKQLMRETARIQAQMKLENKHLFELLQSPEAQEVFKTFTQKKRSS